MLAAQLELLNGRPWTFGSPAECACFVLYAAEWWHREYAGGAWRWTHILESIGPNFYVDVLERTYAVERGLRAWGHQPSGAGKRYLGAIVAQGGLPLQLVAKGDGAIIKLLIRGTRQAQLYAWDSARLEEFFAAHEQDLVQHLLLAHRRWHWVIPSVGKTRGRLLRAPPDQGAADPSAGSSNSVSSSGGP